MIKLPSFLPHPALKGGQMQTIGGYVLSRVAPISADEIIWIDVDDGDQLALEVNQPQNSARGVVILMHGLGGCSESPYILRLTGKLLAEDWIVVRLNHRGCGRHANSVQKLYHSGSTADVWAVLQRVSARWPDLPMVPIAFSLSGTILLNLLGQEFRTCEQLGNWPLSIAVCAPIDLEMSSRQISHWSNLHYSHFFCQLLLHHARRKYPAIYQEAVTAKAQKVWSLRQFDEVITAPYAGFHDRADYYKRCSPRFSVSQIRKPTIILAADDDPIVPGETVANAPYSRYVDLHLQDSGGHLGFVAARRTSCGDYRWMDDAVTLICRSITE
ncbi:MAG: YheT family hydrolase [Oligoflexus sp.]